MNEPSNTIPRKIHYCWFGGKPLPELAQRCLESWRRFFPDYEIVRWDESNFDVDAIPYTAEAYKAGKYAFVSDYARFKILYEHGGLYFDTDVEVIRPMDEIVRGGAFMGCEKKYSAGAGAPAGELGANPGLGLGVAPGLGREDEPDARLLREILDFYEQLNFLNPDGSLNLHTIVEYTGEVLCRHGLQYVPGLQTVAGFKIYPADYFAPKDVDTKRLTITENTRSIHHYDSSWAEWYDKAAGIRGPKLRRMLGDKVGGALNTAIYTIQRFGVRGTLDKIIGKICRR